MLARHVIKPTMLCAWRNISRVCVYNSVILCYYAQLLLETHCQNIISLPWNFHNEHTHTHLVALRHHKDGKLSFINGAHNTQTLSNTCRVQWEWITTTFLTFFFSRIFFARVNCCALCAHAYFLWLIFFWGAISSLDLSNLLIEFDKWGTFQT